MNAVIRLLRTGDRPLEFEGELLAEASSRALHTTPQWRHRWYELKLYSTSAGTLAVAVIFRSAWPDETAQLAATECPDFATVTAWLQAYDPWAPVLGPPAGGPGSVQEQRRARLEKALRAQYDEALGRLLTAFPTTTTGSTLSIR